MKHSLRAAVLAIALTGQAVWATVPLCTVPAAEGKGIGDGCSVPKGLEYLLPTVGIFKSTFTAACDNHDRCLTMLGSDPGQCNTTFGHQVTDACKQFIAHRPKTRDLFIPIGLPGSSYDPAVYLACLETAQAYHGAVAAAFAVNALHTQTLQSSTLERSRTLEQQISSKECDTVPEATGLYSGALIAQVNGTFAATLGRQPTTREFLRAVNSNNLVADRAGWAAYLPQVVSTSVPARATRRLPLYRYVNGYGWHTYTNNWDELGSGKNGYRYVSQMGNLNDVQTVGTQPLHRYRNRLNGDYVYTVTWSQLGAGTEAWEHQGIMGYCASAPSGETSWLLRYNSNSLGHFFTTNWNELLGGGPGGYVYEGIACHVYTSPKLHY